MKIMPVIGTAVGASSQTNWGQVLTSPTRYGVVEIDEPKGEAMKLGVFVMSELSRPTIKVPAGQHIKTILLATPSDDVVHITLWGSGRVYLKRGGSLARLIDRPRSVSGKVKPGDIVVLVSDAASRALSESDLFLLVDTSGAERIAEKIAHKFHEKDPGAAALVFEVKAEVPKPPVETKKNSLWVTIIKSKLGSIPKRRLILGAVTLFVFVFFLVSIALGLIRRQGGVRDAKVTQVLQEASMAIEEGNALFDLNPVKGRERFVVARDLLEPLRATVPEKSDLGREVSQLYASAIEHLATAKNEVLGEPEIYFDPSLLKSGSKASQVALYQNNLVLLDETTRTIYHVDVSSKKGQIVAGGNAYEGAFGIAIHGETGYALKDSGVTSILLNQKQAGSTVIQKSDQWQTIAAIVAYGGNLYLLDTGASRIWKYVATETEFSPINEYLNPDTFVDLSGATNISIDGVLWIGTRDGKILKFVQGRQETFIPLGIEPALSGAIYVYTNDELKNLYILESAQKRVVILDKDGLYLGQYIWQGEFIPDGIVVSEENKRILLLAAGKLYSLELQ